MHTEALDYTRQALRALGGAAGRNVLEVGSLNINGGARELCPDAARYFGVDKVAGPGVDLVADARELGPDEPFDLVICNEVLEHDAAPGEVIAAIARCLKPGGHLILTCASDGRKPHSAYGAEHPLDGEYYGNVSPGALAGYLSGWEVLDLDYLYPPGDARVVARWPGEC